MQHYNISCTCGKSNYIFSLCRFPFPPQNSRKCRCGVLVVCSIHAHVQHLMHLRQSDLHVFSFYFPCPTSRFGKMKLWVVVSRLSNSISSVLPFSFLIFPTSKLRNVIVGAVVSYLCNITSRAPAASQITFSSSVGLFPPQNSRRCRCGVLVVCSIHAHVQHLMHLRQSDLHVFSFRFPCPTFKVRENEIVGGGIGCQIQSLQFCPSQFLPQNSGKGVSYLCKLQHLVYGESNYIFFLCRFPFPTSKLEKM